MLESVKGIAAGLNSGLRLDIARYMYTSFRYDGVDELVDALSDESPGSTHVIEGVGRFSRGNVSCTKIEYRGAV